MKNLKPIFIENSKIPVWLSKFAPITIGAIALFPFVFSRHSITEKTRTHETIHFSATIRDSYHRFLFNIPMGLL